MGGKVTWNIPNERLGNLVDVDFEINGDSSKEIGCTIEKFKKSLKLCKEKIGGKL
jgi:hypothetical protein